MRKLTESMETVLEYIATGVAPVDMARMGSQYYAISFQGLERRGLVESSPNGGSLTETGRAYWNGKNGETETGMGAETVVTVEVEASTVALYVRTFSATTRHILNPVGQGRTLCGSRSSLPELYIGEDGTAHNTDVWMVFGLPACDRCEKSAAKRGIIADTRERDVEIAAAEARTMNTEKTPVESPELSQGDKVVRVGEETGPIGRVRELRYDGRHAFVSFAGLAPSWIRVDRLSKLPTPAEVMALFTPEIAEDLTTRVNDAADKLAAEGTPVENVRQEAVASIERQTMRTGTKVARGGVLGQVLEVCVRAGVALAAVAFGLAEFVWVRVAELVTL